MDLWTVSYIVLWVLVLAEAAVLFILLRTFGSLYLDTAAGISRDGLALGARAPDFVAPGIDGRQVTLREFLGRWLVLFFAAPGCEECYAMLPDLGRLRADLGDGTEIVLVFGASLPDAQSVPLLRNSPIPVLVGGSRGLTARYKVRASPFAQIVDPQGVVRAKGLFNNRERLEHLLADAGHRNPVLDRHHDEGRSS